MRVKAAKWGNSVAVRLPAAVVEQLRLQPGGELEVSATGEAVTLTPVRNRRVITLEEMVAEMKRLGPAYEPETIDWGPDRGAEIIDDDYSKGLIPPPLEVREDDE